MNLTAIYTNKGEFRIHRAGCSEIDKEAAGANYTEDITADSQTEAIRIIWGDIIAENKSYSTVDGLTPLRNATYFVGCAGGLQ